jgi:hypothetical protein
MMLPDFPRYELLRDATLLQRLERTEALNRPGLYVKRDDLMPIAMGGNKLRSLEFWLGAAFGAGGCPARCSGLHRSWGDGRILISRMTRARQHPRVHLLDTCRDLVPAVVRSDKQASTLAQASGQCGIAHEPHYGGGECRYVAIAHD